MYKKYTTDTNWKYVLNFDVQFSQLFNIQGINALTGIKGQGCEKSTQQIIKEICNK